MSRKWMAIVLSTIMFFCSMVGISAKENEITTLSDYDGIPHNHTFSGAVLPDERFFDIVSVSMSERYYSAHREANGDVTLTINEVANTSACYYRFFATDSEGNFNSSKDLEFYIDKAGVHTVRFPASSVSKDGYIYLHFALNPGKGSAIFYEDDYRIPVDYEANKIVNDDYLTIEPNQNYHITGRNGNYYDFSATATRRSNGNVFLQINNINTNAYPLFEQKVSSGPIFLSEHTNTYSMPDTGLYNISLYKDIVSDCSYVYINIYFNRGSYQVEQVKIPIY